jgi:hypothetical protein
MYLLHSCCHCGYRAFTVASCANGRRDNHNLILHTNLYCMWYRTCTSELYRQLSPVVLNGLIWTELLYYDRRSVGQSVLVSSPLLGRMTRFFNTARHLWVCWYGALSLTRGRVCLLQLLLSSPAQSFSGPSPAGLMTTFYCLRFETPPNLEDHFPVYPRISSLWIHVYWAVA